MKKIILGFLLFLLASIQSHAAQTVLVYEWAVTTGKASEFVAAVDALQQSKLGGDRTAQIQLQSSTFNGANAATHRVVVLYQSMAEMEAWSAKFAGSKEQENFLKSIAEVATPVQDYMVQSFTNWGDVSNKDNVWDIVRVNVSDPNAIMNGLNELMSSSSAKGFPGQLWLVGIVRGQASPVGNVTHEIVIGYENYAELEAWQEKMTQTEDWANWMKIASANQTLVNRYFLNNVKVYEHGMTLEDFD